MTTIARIRHTKVIWQQGKDVTIVVYKDLSIAVSHGANFVPINIAIQSNHQNIHPMTTNNRLHER